MESSVTQCEKCKEHYAIAEWPFCPHGKVEGLYDVFKPYLEENLPGGDVVITSPAHRRELCKIHNVHPREKKLRTSVADPGWAFRRAS